MHERGKQCPQARRKGLVRKLVGIADTAHGRAYCLQPSQIPSCLRVVLHLLLRHCNTQDLQLNFAILSYSIIGGFANLSYLNMFAIANGRTGRETPCFGPRPSFSFRPESSSPQSTVSPSREPRFIVGPFESRVDDEPFHGQEPRLTPSESSFRIELTHIREKDLLSPPLPGRRWSISSDATSCDFREVVQKNDVQFTAPRWPSILRFIFRFLILLESIAVLVIATHSVSIYTGSQPIRSTGVDPTSPAEINLFPTSFLQVVAGISLVSSLLTWLHALRSRYTGISSVGDHLAMVSSGLMTGLWVATAAIFRQHESSDEPSLAWLACHQTGSQLKESTDYRLICAEQVRLSLGCCMAEDLELTASRPSSKT